MGFSSWLQIYRFAAFVALILALPQLEASAQRLPPRPSTNPPTVYKPGQPPENVLLWGTPVVTNVKWSAPLTPMPGMTYSVHRSHQSDPTCCINQITGLTSTTWLDEGLLRSGTYIYKVSVRYPDGTIGLVERSYTRPEPRNPQSFTASVISPGNVHLKWDAVPDVSWYQLSGPGIGTFQIVGYTSYVVKGLPPGTYSWRIGSIYSSPNSPNAVSTNPTLFPEAAAIVRD